MTSRTYQWLPRFQSLVSPTKQCLVSWPNELSPPPPRPIISPCSLSKMQQAYESNTMGQQPSRTASNINQTSDPQSDRHTNAITSTWPNGFPHNPSPRHQQTAAARRLPPLIVPARQIQPTRPARPAVPDSPPPVRRGNPLVSAGQVASEPYGTKRRIRFLDEKGVQPVNGREYRDKVEDNEWKDSVRGMEERMKQKD